MKEGNSSLHGAPDVAEHTSTWNHWKERGFLTKICLEHQPIFSWWFTVGWIFSSKFLRTSFIRDTYHRMRSHSTTKEMRSRTLSSLGQKRSWTSTNPKCWLHLVKFHTQQVGFWSSHMHRPNRLRNCCSQIQQAAQSLTYQTVSWFMLRSRCQQSCDESNTRGSKYNHLSPSRLITCQVSKSPWQFAATKKFLV